MPFDGNQVSNIHKFQNRSSGFNDELAWAAAWLDEKARHQVLFQQVKIYYDKFMPTDFSYNNKMVSGYI